MIFKSKQALESQLNNTIKAEERKKNTPEKGAVRDKLEYIYQCTCGGEGVMYWKDGKHYSHCFSCQAHKCWQPQDAIPYEDKHTKTVVGIIARIAGENDAKKMPRHTKFMDSILSLIGCIDVLLIQAKLVSKDLLRYKGEQIEMNLETYQTHKQSDKHRKNYTPPKLWEAAKGV